MSESVAADEPFEPSPFDEDDEAVVTRRPWKPALPLSQEELDSYQRRPMELRLFNPWKCMFNLMAEDGIGYYSGVGRIQCDTVLADPTKSRYCLDHARKMGVDYYAPPELAAAVAAETSANLTRLVPKATKVLETVMDDEDAPAGVRSKAAAEILDRTGYVRGIDVQVDARVATVDVSSLIQDRLNALRDAHKKTSSLRPEVVGGSVVAPDDASVTGDDDTVA